MIERGKYLEGINEKISILRTEIIQSGIMGLTSIHKHCENFVRDFLNTVYDYKLKNLNESANNFAGLDIGDDALGLAFQVTSDKTSSKINDTLNMVIKHNHYTKFPKIRVFLLAEKQNSYTISVITKAHFNFDWEHDIVDFTDVLKDIQNMTLEKLKLVSNFLDEELYQTIKVLKGEEQPMLPSTTYLINIESGIQNTKMNFFSHWVCKFSYKGSPLFAPTIFQKVTHGEKSTLWKQIFYVFGQAYRIKATSQEIIYKESYIRVGAAKTPIRESIIQISENHIQVEYAIYDSQETILTYLFLEIGSLLGILLYNTKLYGSQPIEMSIEIELITNANLIYQPNNILLAHTLPVMRTFILNPRTYKLQKTIKSCDNNDLLQILQDIINGFVCNEQSWFDTSPFLRIDEKEQIKILDIFRSEI